MSAEGYVLDTSALMTLIEDEDGADRVQEVLTTERVYLPWIVLLEVTYVTKQERGTAEAELRYALVKELPGDVLWNIDEETLLTAARIKATHRVSLADAIIAAYASQRNAVLLHKDPEYDSLAGAISLEALPYKTPAL